MRAPRITLSELHAAQERVLGRIRAVSRVCDEIPPDWLSAEQWGRAWKKSEATARKILDVGLKAGIVERKQFRIEGPRRVEKAFFYREIPEPQPVKTHKRTA